MFLKISSQHSQRFLSGPQRQFGGDFNDFALDPLWLSFWGWFYAPAMAYQALRNSVKCFYGICPNSSRVRSGFSPPTHHPPRPIQQSQHTFFLISPVWEMFLVALGFSCGLVCYYCRCRGWGMFWAKLEAIWQLGVQWAATERERERINRCYIFMSKVAKLLAGLVCRNGIRGRYLPWVKVPN